MDRQQLEATLAEYLDRDTMLLDTERLESDLQRHLNALEAIYTYPVVAEARADARELLQAAQIHNDIVIGHRERAAASRGKTIQWLLSSLAMLLGALATILPLAVL
jgi:hypothetical protein